MIMHFSRIYGVYIYLHNAWFMCIYYTPSSKCNSTIINRCVEPIIINYPVAVTTTTILLLLSLFLCNKISLLSQWIRTYTGCCFFKHRLTSVQRLLLQMSSEYSNIRFCSRNNERRRSPGWGIRCWYNIDGYVTVIPAERRTKILTVKYYSSVERGLPTSWLPPIALRTILLYT